ncbi:RidA family protein [Natrialbaceae archaeon A-CW2]|uniref:RidA family protein n=1 Tax=Natronosalvus amylolyticus TaxID=2961994 RepID=UPI0020C96975|nr:RidA family protein [Natronosalvus amylolyticus]
MARETITHEDLPDSSGHSYSHAIVADGRLYMSGQVGMDADRNLAGEEMTAQARQAFANVEKICEAVDRDLQDVVKVTAHIVDPHSRFAEYQAVWDETFESPYPCHTVLGVEQLAGPEYLIELEVEVPLGDG